MPVCVLEINHRAENERIKKEIRRRRRRGIRARGREEARKSLQLPECLNAWNEAHGNKKTKQTLYQIDPVVKTKPIDFNKRMIMICIVSVDIIFVPCVHECVCVSLPSGSHERDKTNQTLEMLEIWVNAPETRLKQNEKCVERIKEHNVIVEIRQPTIVCCMCESWLWLWFVCVRPFVFSSYT